MEEEVSRVIVREEPRKKAPPWRKMSAGRVAAARRWSPEGVRQGGGRWMVRFRQPSGWGSPLGRLDVGREMLVPSDVMLSWGWMLEGVGCVASKVLFLYLGLFFKRV